MVNNILLISEDTLKTYSNLNENAFGSWILPAIREAQNMGLMPIIGECLYDKICNLVGENMITWDVNVAYKDLLDDYIQPYLIYQTLTNIVPILNAKLANLGTVLNKDEYVTNLSQSESDLLQNYYRERADFYQKRLQAFVKANNDAFPELSCDCGKQQANLESSVNSVGLWLGGFRGKQVSKNECACGSSSSSSDDYQRGFQDGIIHQKGLLVETAITENGTYTRENGFNSVEVNVDAPQTGHTDEELEEAYDNGYGDGENYQKSLLSAITITQNGDYERADGYSAITVNVSGQEPSLVSTAITSNGEFFPAQGYDGFSSVEVNIPSTGYTEEEYQAHYSQGYRQGQSFQKSLMTSTAVTENGTYRRTNGFSAFTVNVPQTGISGTQISVQSSVRLNDYGTYYFIYDSATSVDNMTIVFNDTPTPTGYSYSALTYLSYDGNVVEPYISSNYWTGRIMSNTYSSIGTIIFRMSGDNKLNIPLEAFAGRSQLKEIWIPSGTTGKIGWSAFAGTGLQAIHLPNDITEIGHGAFMNCTSLTDIEIPSSVTLIEYDAFQSATTLTSVTVNAITPPQVMTQGSFGWNAFRYTTCTIYVPANSVEEYKAADGWSDYADRIQAIV